MAEQMPRILKPMQNLKLIHPIYLDVPMLISFAAAVRGGVAFDSQVTEETGSQKDSKSLVKARFGLSSLIESILSAGIDASAEGGTSKTDKTRVQESRSHTEASMAILLYDQLSKSSDVLLHPKTHEDFAKIEPGSLVELAGRVEKNAVDTMIDYIEIVNLLSGMSRSSESKEKKIDRNHLDQIRKVLDEDRKRTPLSNITVRCDVPKDLNAVVTLRRDNLRDLTLSELHKNTVRIVGKVTRIVNAGSSMSAFENYGLALMKPSTLTELLKGVSSNSDITADFSEVEIAGPAVQILPLMIYV